MIYRFEIVYILNGAEETKTFEGNGFDELKPKILTFIRSMEGEHEDSFRFLRVKAERIAA